LFKDLNFYTLKIKDAVYFSSDFRVRHLFLLICKQSPNHSASVIYWWDS